MGDVFGYRTAYRIVSLILLSVALIGAVAMLMNGVLTVSKRYKDADAEKKDNSTATA